ncbi:MAG: citrate/2-methylcitrate synthase, partial [Gaiellaceae bacterium]
MAAQTLSITDNRTGARYEIPVEEGAIRASALRQIKVDEDDFGLMSYDPAFLNTASVRSAITFIDGERGILRYRGYPIEQLALESSYLETAYLVLFGELPSEDELSRFGHEITYHTFLHENIKELMQGFRYDAHPMGMFVSVVAALGTLYPEAAKVDDPESRLLQVIRLIAKVPTIAAWSYRHSRGLPYVYPDNELGFAENFLSMMFKIAEPRYDAEPALARALEVLFILHVDHEQNCSA